MAGLCLDSGILAFLLKVRADQTVIALTGTAASTVGKAGVRVASRFGDVGSLVCACLCLFSVFIPCFIFFTSIGPNECLHPQESPRHCSQLCFSLLHC